MEVGGGPARWSEEVHSAAERPLGSDLLSISWGWQGDVVGKRERERDG